MTSNCQGFMTSCIAVRIDDAIVHLDPALVFLRDLAADLEKHAGQRLQYVGLVHDGDLLASVLERIVEREFDDAGACVGASIEQPAAATRLYEPTVNQLVARYGWSISVWKDVAGR